MSTDCRAWHLPAQIAPAATTVIAEHDGFRALAPILTPHDVESVCDTLAAAQRRMREMPVQRVITSIDAAARRLIEPGSAARSEALTALCALSGFSPAMAATLLDRVAADWFATALEQLVDTELGGPAAVENFIQRAPGVRARAVAAPLGFHVFSGNVPGVSITSIVRALLVRSAVMGKTAAGEPVLAPLFARLLEQVDPLLGACVAVTWWAGGDAQREAAVLRRAGLVVHYGSAAAIESLRARAPASTRFVEHGPRISFAIVQLPATDARLEDIARDLATAVALFDQQGCVSPQLAYIIGDAAGAARVAERTAHALAHTQNVLPRGRISSAEATAIRDLRTRAEFSAIAGSETRLWQGPELAWTVILSADPTFEASCLNRTLLIKHVDSADDVIENATPFGSFLQTVGIGGFGSEDRDELAVRLAAIGATRITPITAMPWPPAAWHHDGRGPLRELIRWVDLED